MPVATRPDVNRFVNAAGLQTLSMFLTFCLSFFEAVKNISEPFPDSKMIWLFFFQSKQQVCLSKFSLNGLERRFCTAELYFNFVLYCISHAIIAISSYFMSKQKKEMATVYYVYYSSYIHFIFASVVTGVVVNIVQTWEIPHASIFEVFLCLSALQFFVQAVFLYMFVKDPVSVHSSQMQEFQSVFKKDWYIESLAWKLALLILPYGTFDYIVRALNLQKTKDLFFIFMFFLHAIGGIFFNQHVFYIVWGELKTQVPQVSAIVSAPASTSASTSVSTSASTSTSTSASLLTRSQARAAASASGSLIPSAPLGPGVQPQQPIGILKGNKVNLTSMIDSLQDGEELLKQYLEDFAKRTGLHVVECDKKFSYFKESKERYPMFYLKHDITPYKRHEGCQVILTSAKEAKRQKLNHP